MKTYVVGAYNNTHNTCTGFYGELTKIIPQLSSNMHLFSGILEVSVNECTKTNPKMGATLKAQNHNSS